MAGLTSLPANPSWMKLRTLAVVTVLIAAPIGLSAPVRAADRTDLARVTYISGSQAGAVDVRLDRKARIANPLMGERSLSVTDAGEGFAGFALVATDVADREGFVLLGGRLPKSAGGRSFIDIETKVARKVTVTPVSWCERRPTIGLAGVDSPPPHRRTVRRALTVEPVQECRAECPIAGAALA